MPCITGTATPIARELQHIIQKQARCLSCGSRGTKTRLIDRSKWTFQCSNVRCDSRDFWR